MASLITPQFERYVAEQTVTRGTVQFDEFIFANIPGLNENNLAQYLTMPTSAQIVHRQAVSQSGVINENAVVYSVTIGTEVGDFDFNFIGLINRSKNLLAVAVQTDTVKKIRNKNAVQGNSITRNMLLEFSGAKALTGINVNANTWQIDFTVRLHGLDEKIRLTNRDLYGRAVFFDDGFLVKRKTGNQFTIQPGTAYVEGVRMDLGAEHHLTANSLPCSIYADVVHHCTVTGEYQTEIKYLTQSKADYVDTANRQHYVQILADIDSQGNVTDRRLLSPFLGMNPLTLDDTTENTKDKQGHTHKLPIASLVKKGIAKLFSGCDSDAEDMAATPKAVKTAYNKGKDAQDAADGKVDKKDISHGIDGDDKTKVTSEYAMNLLNKKLSTVIRKSYTHTISANGTWETDRSNNIKVEGYVVIYPNGKIEQYLHIKEFRIKWWDYEKSTNGDRAIEIPLQLWTAMPTKIEFAEAFFSRTQEQNIFNFSMTFGTEASEWNRPSWAFERQAEKGKDKLSFYTYRWKGGSDEPIDMFVKVEGY